MDGCADDVGAQTGVVNHRNVADVDPIDYFAAYRE